MNKHIDISNVTMKTDRLLLRMWKETDLEDFYAYASVEGVGEMAGWTHHQNIEESRRILSHFIDGKHTFALNTTERLSDRSVLKNTAWIIILNLILFPAEKSAMFFQKNSGGKD